MTLPGPSTRRYWNRGLEDPRTGLVLDDERHVELIGALRGAVLAGGVLQAYARRWSAPRRCRRRGRPAAAARLRWIGCIRTPNMVVEIRVVECFSSCRCCCRSGRGGRRARGARWARAVRRVPGARCDRARCVRCGRPRLRRAAADRPPPRVRCGARRRSPYARERPLAGCRKAPSEYRPLDGAVAALVPAGDAHELPLCELGAELGRDAEVVSPTRSACGCTAAT